MMRKQFVSITVSIIVAMAMLVPVHAADQFEPGKCECLVGSKPGGGWDFTCRSVAQVMREIGLVESAIQVTNMVGGGGGVGFANVVTKRNTDNHLFAAASPATTLRLAQKSYGHFTVNDVRWLGAVAADYAVVAVRADSPYKTFEDLMTALKNDVTSVKFGGGSPLGGQDHMKVLILAQSAGIDPLTLKYTAFDAGGEALTAMLGGFVDVFPGDISEVVGQVDAGKVRVLAALAPRRLEVPFDKIPTAKELGYDAQWVVFRGFYAPGKMSDDAYDWWVNALTTVAASPEWSKIRKQRGLGEFFMAGPEFEAFVKKQVANFETLSKALGIIK